MLKPLRGLFLSLLMVLPVSTALADEYDVARDVFMKAGESARYFDASYGYALFPTISKGAVVVGGAYGEGRVFEQGQYVGDTAMTQASIGLQLGGQAFSQIIFFADQRAFREFTSGNFEFGAEASAVGVTAGASAQATTTGISTSKSGNQNDAKTKAPGYYKGMAIFTVAKGGLMFQAAVTGQKFSYRPGR